MSKKKDNKITLDLTDVVSNIGQIRKIKQSRVSSEPKKSVKELTFEIQDSFSLLKTVLIEKINQKELLYQDLYDYCTSFREDKDPTKGRSDAGNMISSLRKGDTMKDDTFTKWCDFLGLEIILIDRDQIKHLGGEDNE